MLREVIRKGGLYTASTFLNRSLGLLTLPIYVSELSIEEVGFFEIVLAVIAIANIVIPMEISQALARYYPAKRYKNIKDRYKFAAIKLTIWSSLTSCALLSIASIFFISSNEVENIIRYNAAFLYFLSFSINHILLTQARVALDIVNFAKSTFFSGIVTIAFAMLFVKLYKFGLNGVLGSFIGGQLAGIIYNHRIIKKIKLFDKIKNIEKVILSRMLKYSIPLIPAGLIFVSKSYMDKMIVGNYLTLEDVGLYGVAYKIAGISAMAIAGLQGVLTPIIHGAAHSKNQNERELQLIFKLSIFAIASMLIILNIFKKELILLIAGSDYVNSVNIMFYLSMAIALNQVYIFFPGIEISEKTNIILKINILSAIVGLLSCVMLTKTMGLNGAAIAALLGSLTFIILYMKESEKYFKMNIFDIRYLGCFVFVVLSDKYSINGNVLDKILYMATLIFFLIIYMNISKMVQYKEIKLITQGKIKK